MDKLVQNRRGTGDQTMLKARIIHRYCCAMHDIRPAELQKAPRTRTWNAIRREIGATLRAETDLSLTEIGQLIGVKKYRRRKPRDTD